MEFAEARSVAPPTRIRCFYPEGRWGAEQKDVVVSLITGLSPQKSGRAWAGRGALVRSARFGSAGRRRGQGSQGSVTAVVRDH